MSYPSLPLISKLPSELILLIFSWYAFSVADAPLNISSVCRAWLQLVRASPELWARLSIHIQSPSDVDIPLDRKYLAEADAVRKATAWFERSGMVALDLRITIRGASKPPTITDLLTIPTQPTPPLAIARRSPLASLFQIHQRRVRTLLIHAPAECDIQPLIQPFHSLGPSEEEDPRQGTLQELELEVTDPLTTGLLPPGADAPATPLPKITPKSVSVRITNLTIPSPWLNLESLTSLTVTQSVLAAPLFLSDIFALLGKSSAMKYLSIHARIAESPTQSSLTPIHFLTLPHLHALHLSLNNTIDVLLALRTPQLSSLSITDLDGRAPWTGRALKAFLTSRPPLKEVKLERLLGIEHGIWEWCLARLSMVESLTLAYCERGEYVLAELSKQTKVNKSGERKMEVCSALRTLSFRQCPGVYDTMLPWFHTIRPHLSMEIVDSSEIESEGDWEGWEGLDSRGWGVHLR
ncbi:hypothetical protein EW146_g7341 [Bondarzewia mesenterica]|uniref:F-box domain-containing protein n=1 Tax=Bondarzewia mesenterica TaxID=1095465 RepID=A0A4S4LMY0_9AGAM|nr:hypothetical protein EW146_g7341 [Bondarzewia mesenterica]